MKIKDCLINEDATFKALCSKRLQGVTKNNELYLNLELKDNTGSMLAKLWNAQTKDLEAFQTGRYYQVTGKISEYRKNKTITIKQYQILNPQEINQDDFVVVAEVDHTALWDEINTCITNLREPYKTILEAVKAKHEARFKTWPAAIRVHHAAKYGLLWHSATMLKVAKALAVIYQDRCIDWDLVYAGIILHDWGKIWEIQDQAGSDLSIKGKLIGHISIMAAELYHVGKALHLKQPKYLVLLQHMIIASHGKQEYGSPVEPKLIEAEILNKLDELDARLFQVNQHLTTLKKDEFSERIFTADGRSYLKHYDS